MEQSVSSSDCEVRERSIRRQPQLKSDILGLSLNAGRLKHLLGDRWHNRMIAGNASSAVNRAIAFYRHFVGIPTDREPPAA
jgi:hypothetical protein